MKNFKKLSREELRSVKGGRGCKLVVPDGNGGYVTHMGTCQSEYVDATFPNGVNISYSISYCETGSGRHQLTSNGGDSRC